MESALRAEAQWRGGYVAAILVPCPSVFSGLGPGLVPAGKIGAVWGCFLLTYYLCYLWEGASTQKQTALAPLARQKSKSSVRIIGSPPAAESVGISSTSGPTILLDISGIPRLGPSREDSRRAAVRSEANGRPTRDVRLRLSRPPLGSLGRCF